MMGLSTNLHSLDLRSTFFTGLRPCSSPIRSSFIKLCSISNPNPRRELPTLRAQISATCLETLVKERQEDREPLFSTQRNGASLVSSVVKFDVACTFPIGDNMSCGEKMKIKLAEVREEFKMSESDCGSSRVQVAQLTTKIKHLSSLLHKKDKQSRRGLIAMVQRRKKLLKYMRRTDWDSFCLSLSKLGLRDNPHYKS
ncbi:unnamed protein product [Microthlaspi erraticum]|uniref:Small ribosomal subunit protein uS15c n=1 Tax=Microthlaspi erraticum TaxID=1685480 RepID=A0A6D2J6Z2_9BRAS|nr:unnamed protein product [Microthlaspi erraticum]